MKKNKIFSISICDIDDNSLLQILLKRIKHKDKTFIITLNSLMILNYYFKKQFHHAVQKADLIIPDGYGIIWASRIFNSPIKNHLPGIDLIYKLLGLSHEKKLSVFLLGSTWEVISQSYRSLVKWFPQAKFLGKYYGYFDKKECLDKQVESNNI